MAYPRQLVTAQPAQEETAEGLVNLWSVSGDSGSGTVPVGPAFAWDNDPGSLTYAGPDPVGDPLAPQRLGLAGVRVRTGRYSSPLIASLGQADDVARARLADSLGVQSSLSFTSICNPALEPGTSSRSRSRPGVGAASHRLLPVHPRRDHPDLPDPHQHPEAVMGIREQLGKDLDALDSAAGGLQTVSATVTDVTDAGTVHLTMLGAPFYDVACTDAYRNRKAGDVVAVRRGAVPVVLWRLARTPRTPTPSPSRKSPGDRPGPHRHQRVHLGHGRTGAGYEEVTQLWTKKDSAGKGVLYAQLASAPDPSPSSRHAGPEDRRHQPHRLRHVAARPPGRLRLQPHTGRLDRARRPPGGWFYGTAIAAACSGKTVASMTVKFTRKRGAGNNAKSACGCTCTTTRRPRPVS
ncbi:hypothetical protein [Streptomyces scabiei]|uniref:hypothetical protein n=1 Tax=Streptomyces scabiei TaxID=1930 RepID=UPI001FF44F78|nr:hypothetical protein [Streptomyces sp. LBUM 1486]